MSAPQTTVAAGDPTAKRSVRDLVRAAISGWLGTALEFMDYQLYSLAAALVFADLFFSDENPAMAVVAAMATYGVGYVARPVGAFFFARLGDKTGRHQGAVLHDPAHGPRRRRSSASCRRTRRWASSRRSCWSSCGSHRASEPVPRSRAPASCSPSTPRPSAAASSPRSWRSAPTAAPCSPPASGRSCSWRISEDEVIAWAWRIPFIGSVVIMLFAVWVRFNLKESPVFEERDDVVDGKALSREETIAARHRDRRPPHARGDEAQADQGVLRSRSCCGSARPATPALIQTYLISYITVVAAAGPLDRRQRRHRLLARRLHHRAALRLAR